jgi:hypothetical protein
MVAARFAKPTNTAFYGISAPFDSQNLVCLTSLLGNDTQGSVCEGSGAQKPSSTSKSMAGGRGERRRIEKHCFDTPCTTCRHLSWSETSYCLVNFKFTMAKTSCF